MPVVLLALHCHVVYRDLRPSNILLGDRGHILLTFFSQWNTVECCINDQAFDNLYCAPGNQRMLLSCFRIIVTN